MRKSIAFIGEETRVNSELYQLLNWRFDVIRYEHIDEGCYKEFAAFKPELVVINMVESSIAYQGLFSYLEENCPQIQVVAISTNSAESSYETYYQSEQFHRILHPTTGRRIVETCTSIIAAKESGKREEAIKKPAERNEKQHILVVDDNAVILRNIKGILENKYSVAVSPSGFHAFVSIGRKTPDLILLDYEMPEMNGKDIIMKLQSDEELKEIPVVFLTSADTKEIVMELMALKPAGYILKPVDSDKLLERIGQIIEK